MNLDRFDGYPGGEEQRQRKPTALERWLALGFDPAEEVGKIGEVGGGELSPQCSIVCDSIYRKNIASEDATKGLSDRPLETFGRRI